MKIKIELIVLLICIVLIASIVYFIFQKKDNVTTTSVEIKPDEESAVIFPDYSDFDHAISQMIQSLFDSGRLKKADGSRYVIAPGRIINDTVQRIDTDQLMVKITKEITNSGQAVFTGAVGPGSEKRTLIAPELTISGKIIQRNVPMPENKQQVEYFFQLKLIDVTTGLSFWQDELLVGKTGTNL